MTMLNRTARLLARPRALGLVGALLIGGALAGPALGAVPECAGNPADTAIGLARGTGTALRSPGEVQAVYARAAVSCLWPAAQADALLAVIGRAADHGLDPDLFHASAIAERSPSAGPGAAAERDMLLTDGALTYARTMMGGAVDTRTIEPDVDVPRPVMDVAGDLEAALARGDVAGWLAGLPPAMPQYAGLKEALARYREIAGAGGWQALPEGPTVEPGEQGPVVAALAERLAREGDLAAAPVEPVLSGALLDALKRFQARHGLAVDGRVGRETRAALNEPVEGRIGQIEANLERIREFARVTPMTRLEVNAAAATIEVIRDDRPVLAMRAVVGDPKHKTPILLSRIRSFLINPPWIVPDSIIAHEIWPKIKRDPTYLDRNHMHWASTPEYSRLVQAPGPWNSLGRLKFEFANPFDVYVHDTPERALFARADRARSHGCMRAQHPIELALELLGGDTEWDRARIEQVIASRETTRVPLPVSMPVLVTYRTAFVDQDGTVQFRKDRYLRDERLLAAMARQRAPRVGAIRPSKSSPDRV